MEALKHTYNQFHNLYSSMSPSQRATLVVVPIMIVGSLAFLMYNSQSSSYTAVSYGKVFLSEELSRAEQSLIDSGLNDFRREGQRIFVPSSQVERYNAALLESGNLPSDWGSELEHSLEKRSIFTGKEQLQTMKEIALAKELRRVIRAVPSIDDASVIWARPNKRRWPGNNQNVTATVNVRPRRGRELSIQLVQSLRAAVANMVPDLSPDDVTIFDQSTGVSHTSNKDDAFDNRLVSWIKQHTQSYQEKIKATLSYIPDVLVSVNVDVDNLQRWVEESTKFDPKGTVPTFTKEQIRSEDFRQQPQQSEPGSNSNQPRNLQTQGGSAKVRNTSETISSNVNAPSFTKFQKEYIAAMPKAVQVSVQIPADYYRKVALKRGLTEGTTDQEKDDFQKSVKTIETEIQGVVQATVAKNIPADSATDAITVSSFDQVDTEPTELSMPLTEKVGSAFSQWGSTIGLALFALWALRMLHKSMPKIPDEEITPAVPIAAQPAEDEEDSPPSIVIPPNTRRDDLQNVVRDNPEMAAAVLSKWLKPDG